MIALLWLLLLVPLVVGWLAQDRVQSLFGRDRTVAKRMRVTGAEAARALLDAHGLRRVRIELIPGVLTDHSDGARDVLRLPGPVAVERSVAALGIAAHEVSDAYQDADGSRAYRIRLAVAEPLARVAPWSGLFFIGQRTAPRRHDGVLANDEERVGADRRQDGQHPLQVAHQASLPLDVATDPPPRGRRPAATAGPRGRRRR